MYLNTVVPLFAAKVFILPWNTTDMEYKIKCSKLFFVYQWDANFLLRPIAL